MTTFIDKTDHVGDTATSDPAVDRRTDVGAGVTAGGLAPAVAVAIPVTPPDLRADLRNWKDEVLSAIRYERAAGSSTYASPYGSSSASASGSNLQTKEAVAEVGHAVKADAYQMKDQAETYVMNQPLKAVGIAAGVGFVLGVLWNSRH